MTPLSLTSEAFSINPKVRSLEDDLILCSCCLAYDVDPREREICRGDFKDMVIVESLVARSKNALSDLSILVDIVSYRADWKIISASSCFAVKSSW